jgi:hypothetical protein
MCHKKIDTKFAGNGENLGTPGPEPNLGQNSVLMYRTTVMSPQCVPCFFETAIEGKYLLPPFHP